MRHILLLGSALLLSSVPAFAQECPPAPSSRMNAAQRAEAEAWRAYRDSLQAEVIQALRDAGHANPAGLVVIDVTDRRTGRADVHPYTTPELASAVRAVLATREARLAELPGRESLVHLRLDPLPAPAEGAHECGPRMVDPAALAHRTGEALSRLARSDPGVFSRGSSQDVYVKMLISREGDVVHVELSRRGNRPEVERTILELVRQVLFVPASVGGVPVDVWAQQPFAMPTPARSSNMRSRRRP